MVSVELQVTDVEILGERNKLSGVHLLALMSAMLLPLIKYSGQLLHTVLDMPACI